MNYILQYQMYIAKKKRNNLVYILLLDHRIEHRSPIHFLQTIKTSEGEQF